MDNESKLEITRIEIRNVLGIKEHIVEPGKITLLSGGNGKGKSSVLKSMHCMIGGGNLATLRNVNATDDEPSEMVMELVGGGQEYKIKKTPGKLEVKRRIGNTAAFEKIEQSPQQFLDSLFDGVLVNPLEFVRVDDKQRVKILLEALDLDYDRDAMFEALGLSHGDFPAVPDGLHPLVEIEQHRRNIFERRTSINRDEKSARSSADETRRDIPANIPEDEDAYSKQDELYALRDRISTIRTEAHNNLRNSKNKAVDFTTVMGKKLNSEAEQYASECNIEFFNSRSAIDTAIATIRAEAERRISEIRAEAEQKVSERMSIVSDLKSEMDSKIKAQKDQHETLLEEARATRKNLESKADSDFIAANDEANELQYKAEELATEIATIREQQKTAIALRALKAQADKQEAKAESLKGQSDAFTDALKCLDNYRASLVDELPIKGIDITDNKFTVDGVPWEHVNTAKQYDVAMQVACLRLTDKFRPVFCDGIEALDPENFNTFETLKKYDAQAMLAKVTGDSLKVEVI